MLGQGWTDPGINGDRVAPTAARAARGIAPGVCASDSLQGVPGVDPTTAVRKEIRATRIKHAPPEVDGRLDESVWGAAEYVCDFWQREPDVGQRATQATAVAILYDDEALYVGGRMRRDDPRRIQAFVARRDEGTASERLAVSLDSYRDRRTAYTFIVNAAGVRTDYFHPLDAPMPRDLSFDPVWEAQVHRDSLGWTAEMRIPFSQLRFNIETSQVWGINFNRYIPDLDENLLWALVVRGEPGWSSRFGHLVGLEGIGRRRPVELLPYVAMGLDVRDVDPLDAVNPGVDPDLRLGGDLKVGLGPALTLDVTVNPDFGQVEADPAVVNLTAFETVFEERRPFFTEGRQLLEGNAARYYYSRRIGAPPHADVEGDFVRVPEATTILGAAKLTGRFRSGTSVGGLLAVTGEEKALVLELSSGGKPRRVTAEPLSFFGVGRVQREFGAYTSTVGLTLTAVRRDVAAPPVGLLPRAAYAGGPDWNLRFGRGDYALRGNAGLSYVAGDTAAILDLQRSSARYYQRPDAETVRLDPSRRSLSGWLASLELAKEGGRHWLFRTELTAVSPGYEINDVGQRTTVDELSVEADLTLREVLPGSVFQNWSVGFTSEHEWNFDGIHTETSLGLQSELTWKSFISTNAQLTFNPRVLSEDLTRGGPLMQTGRQWTGSLEATNSRGSATRWTVGATFGSDEFGGWLAELQAGLTFRPADRVILQLDPTYRRELDTRQYFDTLDDGRPDTFGRRYVFSSIARSTISSQVRASYAFLPDLTVELYAEPFAASGRRSGFGELLEPGGRDLLVYGTQGTAVRSNKDGSRTVTTEADTFTLGNGDFNRLSFRSNIVLRWEWTPGSTLFVVWQQERGDETQEGRLVAPSHLLKAFGSSGAHSFVIKASYWLPL